MLRRTVLTGTLLLSAIALANGRQLPAIRSGVRSLIDMVDVTDANNQVAFAADLPAIQPAPSLTSHNRSLSLGAPEPGTFLLFGGSLVLLGVVRRTRRSRQ